mgnify:CR=1 FL=1
MMGYRRPFLGRAIALGQGWTARIEVRDAATEAYIEGADVRVFYPGGSIAKRTDRGGNAGFFESDFAGIMPPEVLESVMRVRVERPGYEPQERPLVSGEIMTFDLAPGRAPAGRTETAYELSPCAQMAVLGVGGALFAVLAAPGAADSPLLWLPTAAFAGIGVYGAVEAVRIGCMGTRA